MTNNYWFSDSMKGFLLVPIMVLDGAGNDTATLKVRTFNPGSDDMYLDISIDLKVEYHLQSFTYM